MDDSPNPCAAILHRSAQGEPAAANRLFELLYEELHALASRMLARERRAQTLQTTAVLHEAYLRLLKQSKIPADDRSHFFAIAALQMRRVLRDHAKKSSAEKRGGRVNRITLDVDLVPAESTAVDFLVLDEALVEFEQVDPRAVRVVELRYIAGLTVEETARTLGVAERTVNQDWTFARAWLQRRMERGEPS